MYESVFLPVESPGNVLRRELTYSSVPVDGPCVVLRCCSSTHTSLLGHGHKTS